MVLHFQLGNERDRTEYQLFVSPSLVARMRDARNWLVVVVMSCFEANISDKLKALIPHLLH